MVANDWMKTTFVVYKISPLDASAFEIVFEHLFSDESWRPGKLSSSANSTPMSTSEMVEILRGKGRKLGDDRCLVSGPNFYLGILADIRTKTPRIRCGWLRCGYSC